MKIIGIIAEYNPFHNGHAYQLATIRQKTGADYIIIVMSGDFVQRGAPAIIDKYARTKMALSCGADLVIELPTLWAASSAESFAMAGVTLFDKMGCVDRLCFGAETDDLTLLMQLADILSEEPEAYKKTLFSYIKEGLNFPAARAKALCDICAQMAVPSSCTAENRQTETLHEVLNHPNNILAIEYLKALKRRNSSIKPFLLKREGAGYHDTKLCSATASATAIRNVLLEASTSADRASLKNVIPSPALCILTDYLAENPLIEPDDFSSIVGYLLLTATPESLACIGDSNADIAHRLMNNRMTFRSFTGFCAANKSRDITYTRMSRVLVHMLLGFTNDDYRFYKELDFIPYLRVLGFRKDSAGLFQIIKKETNVPLVTKLAAADTVLSKDALRLLEKDIFAADLYEQIKAQKGTTPRSEYTREIVRV